MINANKSWCFGFETICHVNIFSLDYKMMRLIILTILLPLAWTICYNQCQQCDNSNANSSPYACLSCFPNNNTPYISSCPAKSDQFSYFVAPAIIVTLLHLFLLSIGMGMYRQIFEHIQLASLVGLRYDFQGGSVAMQATNFGIINSNNFQDTYAYQFIAFLLILTVFLTVVMFTDRMVHSPTAALLRRKKVIFPVRLITLTFNALLLSSLIQLTNINDVMTIQIAPFVLSVLAISVVVVMLIAVAVISNWKKFQVDDPNYYVLLEQMTSKKWYAKNNILLSLLTRTIIICVYVGLYKSPQASGIVMTIFQGGYTIYFISLIRFNKIRYFVISIIGNVLMIGILLAIYVGSINDINSQGWKASALAYIILLTGLVVLYFWVCVMEIIFRRDRILKQLKSFYSRFIKCQKIEDQIQISKYDEHGHRQRVKEFQANLLYQKDLHEDKTIDIEMQETFKQ